MTRPEEEFLRRWNAERPDYERWGAFVVSHLNNRLADHLGQERFSSFVRVPAECRLKDEDSLLQKAFYREKNYKNPFEDIEDKIGVRFVLLLSQDMRLVGKEIETEETVWDAVKARDHEEEIDRNPSVFDYQSLHYIIRSKGNQEWQGHPVPNSIPCEVQVRTLLQHAYSELTHDTIYKPSITATSKMKRAAAKSMALIEATSDYFDELDNLISEVTLPLRKLSKFTADQYQEHVEEAPAGETSPLNQLILDHYGQFHAHIEEPLAAWLRLRPYLGDRIRERRQNRPIFKLPSILLVYFFAQTETNRSKTSSPVLEADLELIFSDLGLSLHG